jgi:hypothetical protein
MRNGDWIKSVLKGIVEASPPNGPVRGYVVDLLNGIFFQSGGNTFPNTGSHLIFLRRDIG